jgi:multiple sugar transport system permease protein
VSFPRPLEKASLTSNIVFRTALLVALIVWMLPIFTVVLTSTHTANTIFMGQYWSAPQGVSAAVENYHAVLFSTRMPRYLLNSMLIAIPVVVLTLALSSMAGFALAKYSFPGNMLLLALFIGGNFVPHQILMIPVRQLTVQLGLYDTLWALIAFHTAFQTGFATLFMRNFIKKLPHELFEAARAEGATEFQILTLVALPLLRPALAALGVLTFTFVWNDYFWALVLQQSDDVRPVTLGLSAMRGQWETAWNLVSAGAIIIALPPVVLFLLAQRHFIAGLTVGATKG